MEKLTRNLIECHLMSAIEVSGRVQRDGVERWAWCLSASVVPPSIYLGAREESFEFQSAETARKFAFGWIARNRPDLERAAVREALEGIAYRARMKKKIGT